MPDDTTETDQVRSFTDWITEHARGSLADELTAAMADVGLAVSTLDKPGTVTLKIKVKPIGSGDRTVVTSDRLPAGPPGTGRPRRLREHRRSGPRPTRLARRRRRGRPGPGPAAPRHRHRDLRRCG